LVELGGQDATEGLFVLIQRLRKLVILQILESY
jgi:hypothetical protein